VSCFTYSAAKWGREIWDWWHAIVYLALCICFVLVSDSIVFESGLVVGATAADAFSNLVLG